MAIRAILWAMLMGVFLAAAEDPLAAPEDLKAFARRVTLIHISTNARLQALLDGFLRSEADGGMGITYDNAYTRTVSEAWRDRKANCLSMTAMYISACEAVGIRAHYAEALNTNRWRRVGSVVRFERHLVALVPQPPMEDVVADFLPQLRKRMGIYRVSTLEPDRVRALFYANRAVESLEQGRADEAEALVRESLGREPNVSVGWNILGVILKQQGKQAEAEDAFRQALKRDPRDSSAIGNMETLMRDLGRLDEAKRFRELGQEVRKKDPYFFAFLAEEAMGEGRLEDAKTAIKKAIKLLPQEPEFHLSQARLNLLLNQPEEAAKNLEEAARRASPVERKRYENKLKTLQLEMDKKP